MCASHNIVATVKYCITDHLNIQLQWHASWATANLASADVGFELNISSLSYQINQFILSINYVNKSDIKTNLKLEISLPVYSNLDKSLKHLSPSTRNKTDLISPQSKSWSEIGESKSWSVDLWLFALKTVREVFYVVYPFPGLDGGLNCIWEEEKP